MSRLASKCLSRRRALPVLAALLAAISPRPVAAAPDEAERLLGLLGVGEGAVVADIGAGDGALAVAVARRIGPSGRVYATELEEAQRAKIRAAAEHAGVANLEVRTAEIAATGLPTACCDAIYLHHVYHHLSEPQAIGRDIARALRPGGRLAIIDFPPTWYLSPWSPGGVSESRAGHGIEAAAVVEELTALGFEAVRTEASWSTRWIGPDPFAVVVRKREGTSGGASGASWLAQGRAAVARAKARVGPQPRARNAILFIGDGMGVATVTAARILEGQRRGETGEENALAFEALPFTALAKTYNTDFQVPDSAGTMTAMVTGAKTRAGVLSLDETVARGDFAAGARPGVRLRTLFEEAEDRGRWTGLVTTTTVTHATPGACYAHTPDRNWESDGLLPPAARDAGFPDIARQLVEFPNGDGVEVVLGGGRAHFLPKESVDPERPDARGARADRRDLVEAWRKRFPGGVYAWNRAQLEAADGGTVRNLLGLFDPSHMKWEADRARDAGGEPSLAEMTAKALDVLERAPEGYLLMVEGGRIDHGHHAGNAARALGDAVAFSDAVRVALERTNPAETLVVVTADHSHTLTLSGYPRRGNPILGLVVGASGEAVGGSEPVRDLSGRPYATLSYANGPGYPGASDVQPEGAKRFPHLPKGAQGATLGRPDLSGLDPADAGHLQEATVPLPSETHGGEDVPIYAGGPGAALFHGAHEQTYVYHAMVEALGWGGAP